jgi:hypothetical protein
MSDTPSTTNPSTPTGTSAGMANLDPGDETVTAVLRDLADRGYRAQYLPGPTPGSLQCTACGAASPGEAYEIVEERRLEGTSDPDDMVLVVAARCPACGARGSIVLGYGPDASVDDSDVVLALRR